MKKGFTLIELIGVIILLSLLSLLVFPSILNNIKNTNKQLDEANRKIILSSAETYVSKYGNLFKKKNDHVYCLTMKDLALENLIESSMYNGSISKEISLDTFIKVSVINDNFQYQITNECEPIIILPEIAISVVGTPFNDKGWAKDNFFVAMTSTGTKFQYCIDTKECNPVTEIKNSRGNAYVTNNSTTNYVCAKAISDVGESDVVCSEPYKLDKVKPVLTAKNDSVIITIGDSNLIETYFNSPIYGISGGSLQCDPINTNILSSGTQTIHCTATSNSGLITTASKNIKVQETLLTLLKGQTDNGIVCSNDICYFKGNSSIVNKNFVWYEGHLWRAVDINTHSKTITLMTQQPITSIQPASSVWTNVATYESSFINLWLNNVFYKNISDKSKIVRSTFNVGSYDDIYSIKTTQYVGTLDVEDYKRAGESDSYLNIMDWWWVSNYYDSTHVYSVTNGGTLGGYSCSFAYGIRPVIKITDIDEPLGEGTLENPYRLASTSTSTSNVKIGEYISIPGSTSYCGKDGRCLFRVVSKENDSIKVILNGVLPTQSAFSNDSVTFTTNSIINTPLVNFANSISSTYRYTGNKTFNIGMYEYKSGVGQDFSKLNSQTINVNVGLPVIGEMFSGNDIDIGNSEKTFVNQMVIENGNVGTGFWMMNAYNTTFYVWYTNLNGDLSYNSRSVSYGVRPTLYLKNNLSFTSGIGTAEQPYIIN